MADNILTVSDLSVAKGRRVILEKISFEIKAGETLEKAVLREVKEEIGLAGKVEAEIGVNSYTASDPERGKIRKTVIYFLVSTKAFISIYILVSFIVFEIILFKVSIKSIPYISNIILYVA